MPRVIIFYAQEDREAGNRLGEALAAEGISVWDDQQSLFEGSSYPEALEAIIAAQDVVILCWSAAARVDRFVDVEWRTTLDQSTPVIAYQLDNTPFPTSLSAFDNTATKDVEETVEAVLAMLGGLAPDVGDGRQDKQSDSVEETPGPVFIDTGVGDRMPRRWFEKTGAWVALLAGVLTIIGGLFSTWDKIEGVFGPGTPPDTVNADNTMTYALAGTIFDQDSRDPLRGVTVKITYQGKTDSTVTDANGNYRFDDIPVMQVSLRAEKEGFTPKTSDPMLPNLKQDFPMQKQRP